MKRRAAVEPGICHLKQEHRLPNRLKGVLSDQMNAILSAAGMNFRRLLLTNLPFKREEYVLSLYFIERHLAYENLSNDPS
ncbi:MAG: hypothetical protein KJ900_17600 [Proteobacteria bacterium]|nr:hypothetical protein [Desulfocapsa sp.]MBU4030509.1 hypothetical protein [Pseudomonadota bacterium]MBU4044679.1 hypothetical protein [Pseudomonadota bacterium]MBU4395381.1 hypothetical protein [Pseudomonadota bacterium]